MKPMKTFFITCFVSTLLFLQALSTAAESPKSTLLDISVEPKNGKGTLVLKFDHTPPKYQFTLRKTENYQVLIFSLPNQTNTNFKIPNPEPPFHDIQLAKASKNGISYLEVAAYFELSETLSPSISGNSILTSFSLSPVPTQTPISVKAPLPNQVDENILSITADFSPSAPSPINLLSEDKKKAIFLFYNCISSENGEKPLNSSLVNKISQQVGKTSQNVPYLKWVIESNQEIIADLVKEKHRLYIEVYGMQQPQTPLLENQSSEEVIEEEYIRELESKTNKSENQEESNTAWVKWVYIGIGGVILAGTGLAAYLFLSNQKSPTPSKIPDPIPGDLFPPKNALNLFTSPPIH